MIKNIAIAAFIFYCGFKVGRTVLNKRIYERVLRLHKFEESIKHENNQMVENFAQLYSMTEHNPHEFTEVDAMLASMWMD